MSERNDGGPAFPVEIDSDGRGKQTGPNSIMSTGVSVRDYAAIKAMQAMLASGDFATDDMMQIDMESVANDSYKMANAMLKAREHKEE